LLSGDGSADQKRERRQARRRIRPHATHRRRRNTRVEEDPRGRPPCSQRLHGMVGPPTRADEAEKLLQRRFAIIQVWRPIRHPVETYPLAMADAQQLSPQDMILTERLAP